MRGESLFLPRAVIASGAEGGRADVADGLTSQVMEVPNPGGRPLRVQLRDDHTAEATIASGG